MAKRSRPQSQQIGEQFEKVFYTLLKRLLKEIGFQITKERRQTKGTQFGRDFHFKWKDNTGAESSWFFECKNYNNSPPDTSEVLGKLAQARSSAHQVDNWVLVSPHYDVSNEVDELLEKERKQYPFKIATWTPATGIRNLFSLYPDLYKQVYHEPVSLSETERQQYLIRWKQQLSRSHVQKRTISSLELKELEEIYQIIKDVEEVIERGRGLDLVDLPSTQGRIKSVHKLVFRLSNFSTDDDKLKSLLIEYGGIVAEYWTVLSEDYSQKVGDDLRQIEKKKIQEKAKVCFQKSKLKLSEIL
jgi:hypothetical protein